MIDINIIAHDGISSLYTGVGRIVYDSISVLSREQLLPVKYRVNAITGKYNRHCLGYNTNLKKEIRRKLERTGGVLYECLNGSSGEISYGKPANWRAASLSAATILKFLSEQISNQVTSVNLCLDTPFAQTANYFAQYKGSGAIFVWIPHSTGLIHKIDSAVTGSADYLDERVDWEKQAIAFANQTDMVFVGYVSKFMQHHLIDDYNAKPVKLMDFINGLDQSNARFQTAWSQDKLHQLLTKYHIPADKKLLFSFGRLESYKGFDFTIKLGGLLEKNGYQTVLMAQPYYQGDPNVKKMRGLIAKHNPKAIFLPDYPFDLPHKLLLWQNTRILLIPSKAEPFGLIPEEARLYHNPALAIVVSNRGGLVEQITDGVDGFIIDITDLAANYKRILAIDRKTAEEISAIAKAGHQRACQNYDLIKNLAHSLVSILKL